MDVAVSRLRQVSFAFVLARKDTDEAASFQRLIHYRVPGSHLRVFHKKTPADARVCFRFKIAAFTEA